MTDMKEERTMVINYASYSVLKGVIQGAFPSGGFTLPEWEELPLINASSDSPTAKVCDSEDALTNIISKNWDLYIGSYHFDLSDPETKRLFLTAIRMDLLRVSEQSRKDGVEGQQTECGACGRQVLFRIDGTLVCSSCGGME